MKTVAGYEITEDDYAALAHIVLEPKTWIEHVVSNFPPVLAAEHIAHKIEKCTTKWQAADRPTKTRAEREAEEQALLVPSAEDIRLRHELRLVTLRTELAAADGLELAQKHLKRQIAELEAAMRSPE